jgi:AcrR family transcriptional regulator
MSTTVDNKSRKRKNRPRSSSAETRARVLEIARVAFCEASFDHVGIREIAARGSTDPAIIMRLFGSKEALFEEVARSAFDLEAAFEVKIEEMGAAIAELLLSSEKSINGPGEFEPFHLLLHSVSSPVAAPIVSASLHAGFVRPLATHIGETSAEGRAALVTACVLGFVTMRFALRSPALQEPAVEALRPKFAAAIQACLDADTES